MQKQERLSVLMDGERTEDQVIDDRLCDQLLHDHGLQQQWQCYHLIRDTLRGNLSQDLSVDFAARVAHALQNDKPPLYRVPSGLAAYRATGQRWWRAWAASMNQLGEISLAAGVALLLLYGAHWYQGASVTASRHQASLNPLPLGGETLPVGYSRSSQQRQALRQQLLDDKMNDYARLRLQQFDDNKNFN